MKCQHEPDLAQIAPADGAPGIVDVPCRKCGALGSVRIEIEAIQWEELEEQLNRHMGLLADAIRDRRLGT